MGGGASKPKDEEQVETSETAGDPQKNEATDTTPVESINTDEVAPEKPLITILFGKPGAGKGTHGPYIADKLEIPTLSTGDMLRAAVANETEVGKKCKEVMNAGHLVPDELVLEVVKEATTHLKRGFILDGFPRTIEQNSMFVEHLSEKGHEISALVHFSVSDEALEHRITGRWIHMSSGRSYHVETAKPKSLVDAGEDADPAEHNMLDDVTGEPLSRRKDDTAEALKKRLESFHAQTAPVLDFYRGRGAVHEIDVNRSISDIRAAMENLVEKLQQHW
mmetsp:Transcript_36534/g.53601  ORF Transcript_36534/g.53601 Transcript_36534/m.53601 type:complete len:278 (+) Transcript_36534:83-916(+)